MSRKRIKSIKAEQPVCTNIFCIFYNENIKTWNKTDCEKIQLDNSFDIEKCRAFKKYKQCGW